MGNVAAFLAMLSVTLVGGAKVSFWLHDNQMARRKWSGFD